MGNTYIAIKVVLEELGINIIVPPKCNKRTLEIGMNLSPEGICLPFKLNMGNFIESIELGADTILMISSCGDICRVGMFHQLQEEILNDLGYNITMIPVKPFGGINEIKEFVKVIKGLSNSKSNLFVYRSFIKGLRILFLTDEVYKLVNKIRAKEVNKGEVTKIVTEMEVRLKKASGYYETIKLLKEIKEKVKDVEIDENRDVLRVGIVGEIYTVVEPYVNMNIEERLGEMGVETSKLMTTSEFIKKHLEFVPFIKSDIKALERCNLYLDKEIGGHTYETVASSVLFKEKNYDGIIHILPFGCMPEIVSRGILEEVERKENIPILTMVFDEMTGEAGYLTRLEAFIDCIKRRKEIIKNEEECIPWS
jgi:predicted nucleotide-binding protein (sugar kinase/HSP70/actin superfamily)